MGDNDMGGNARDNSFSFRFCLFVYLFHKLWVNKQWHLLMFKVKNFPRTGSAFVLEWDWKDAFKSNFGYSMPKNKNLKYFEP